MFHHSTTLHHQHEFFSGSSREHRLVHAGKLAEWKIKGAMAWDYMRPLRKLGRIYSWAFGWPAISKGIDYSMQLGGKVVDGIEWGAYTASEGLKGALQMVSAPPAMVAYSRPVAIKRMLVDVPWATAGAAVKTPIAMMKAPFEFLGGVWDSIKKTRKNIGEVLGSVWDLDPMGVLKGTRQAITDVFVPPFQRGIMPVLAPAGQWIDTAGGAEAQTRTTIFRGAPQKFMEGLDRFWNAPSRATAIKAERDAIRQALREKNEKEKEANQKALEDAVKEGQGKAVDKKGG